MLRRVRGDSNRRAIVVRCDSDEEVTNEVVARVFRGGDPGSRMLMKTWKRIDNAGGLTEAEVTNARRAFEDPTFIYRSDAVDVGPRATGRDRLLDDKMTDASLGQFVANSTASTAHWLAARTRTVARATPTGIGASLTPCSHRRAVDVVS
jgi:hypothetical protein